MTKPVILTGLRANSDLTIGNYFGGIKPMIDMATTRADEYDINMFIPDLHSFTTPIDHDTLQSQILNNARIYAAAGLPLDNEGIRLYRQSYVPAHSELTWILDCFTGMGQMKRMTQFKDKSNILEISEQLGSEMHFSKIILERARQGKESYDKVFDSFTRLIDVISAHEEKNDTLKSSVGLFNYPVLMAADILLYNARYIPVGDDQTQHIEFTRDIAYKMNKNFGDIFTVPLSTQDQHEFFGKGQGLRIKDLQDPAKKMSKSDESGKGVIFLGDAPEAAHKKIMGATTDDKAFVDFDRVNQPGISNLLEILALLRGASLDDVVAEYKGQTKYGDFKKVVADEMSAFLTNFQQRLTTIDNQQIFDKLADSEDAVSKTANETLLRAQQAVGLRPKA